MLHLFQSPSGAFCSTCRPLWRRVPSVILPPSLNLPMLLPWDKAGSDSGGVRGRFVGTGVAYVTLSAKWIHLSATVSDRLRNRKSQRISLDRVWNLSHKEGLCRRGGQPQGLSPFYHPLNCTKKCQESPSWLRSLIVVYPTFARQCFRQSKVRDGWWKEALSAAQMQKGALQGGGGMMSCAISCLCLLMVFCFCFFN